MNIITEFFLLFKSNAKEVRKDVNELNQSSKNLEKELGKTDEQLDRITQKLLSIAVEGIAAFAGFQGIKAGIRDAYDFNLQLDKTQKLTGQNAVEVAAWDRAFQSFGADKGEFTSWFTSYSQFLQSIGLDSKNILPNLRALSDELRRLPEDQARLRFQQIAKATGLPQNFYLALREGGAALDAVLEKQRELIANTTEGEKASRRFAQAWQDAGNVVSNVFTQLWDHILIGGFHVVDTFKELLSGNFSKAFDMWRSGGAAPSPSISSPNAPLGIRNNNPGNLMHGGIFDRYPSLAAGLKAEQDLLATYGRKGRNTLRSIASHWAPAAAGNDVASYIKSLVNQTGFGADQPLNLSDPSIQARVANAINGQENGHSFNKLIASAKNALNIADHSDFNNAFKSGNGGSGTLNVGTVIVNTNATDARGIAAAIADRLKQEYRLVINSFDDGVQK